LLQTVTIKIKKKLGTYRQNSLNYYVMRNEKTTKKAKVLLKVRRSKSFPIWEGLLDNIVQLPILTKRSFYV